MKNTGFYLAAIFAIALCSTVQAQDALSGLIKSAPDDATKLLNAYATPLFKGIGTGANGGWTNTAETKGLLHFDVRFTASATFISSSDKTFDVTKLGLRDATPTNPNQTITPTFGGQKNIDGVTLDIRDDNGHKVGTYTLPGGVSSVIPIPQLQATVGLPANTDITVRAIPKIKISDDVGSISMIGVGLKHNIMRDIAGKTADKLIPFDLAVVVAYSHINMNKPLTVNPDNGAQPKDNQQSTDFSNQHLNGNFNTFLGELVLSKKLPVITPFIAVGYNLGRTNVTAVGNYPITTGATLTHETYTTFTNPINIQRNNVDGVRADIGFQLTLGFFRLYASYSQAQYASVNGGVGFGI
ncbi:MAG TPA: DUF6588 family protein [Mucilaginibacter sp.]